MVGSPRPRHDARDRADVRRPCAACRAGGARGHARGLDDRGERRPQSRPRVAAARPAARRRRRRAGRRRPSLRERLAGHRRAPARASGRRSCWHRGVRLGSHDVDHLVLGASRRTRGVPRDADRLDGAMPGCHRLHRDRRRGSLAPRAAVTQDVRLSHAPGQHRLGRTSHLLGWGAVLAGDGWRLRARGAVPGWRDRPGRIRRARRGRHRRRGRCAAGAGSRAQARAAARQARAACGA